MKFKKILLFLLLFIFKNIWSQHYNTQTYNYKNGLPSSGIFSSASDNISNNLWISTRIDGIYKYNGTKMLNFKPKQEENNVHSSHVYKDSKGQIWYISYIESYIFYSRIEQFEKNKIDTIRNLSINFFETKSIDIFYINNTPYIFQTQSNEINYFNLDTKVAYKITLPYTINSISFNSEKIIVSHGKGIDQIYSSNNTLAVQSIFKTNSVECAVYDKNLKLLWAYSAGKLITLNLYGDILKSISINSRFLNRHIGMKIFNTQLFIYSSNFTIRYNTINNSYINLNEQNGLLDNGSNDIEIDKEGNTWICQNSGLVKLSAIELITYSGRDLHFKENEISAIKSISNKEILISNSYSLSVFNKFLKSLRTIDIPNSNFTIRNRILDITANSQNYFLISYYNRFSYFKDNQLHLLSDTIENGCFSSVIFDNQVFFCQNNKLYHTYQNKSNLISLVFKSKEEGGIIRKLVKKSENEIILCSRTGATLYNLKKHISQSVLQNESVYNYLWDSLKQIEYFACYSGLILKIKDKISKITLPNSPKVYAILKDRYNKLWIGTNNGVLILDSNCKLILELTPSIGLKGQEVNRSAFELDDEDNLWVGTNDGLNIIYTNFNTSKFTPPLLLSSILVNDQIANRPNNIYNYFENSLKFNFEFSSFINENLNSYSYFLVGYDKAWSNFSSNNFSAYKNLPPGKYELKIRAQNALNNTSNIIKYKFEILSPWWHTWWFYIICIFLGLITIYFLFQWRLKTLNKKEKNKQLITESELKALRSQINPHYLSNSMVSVQNLILNDNIEKAIDTLALYGKVMRSILENSEQQFLPINKEIESLQLYLDLESTRNGQNYNFKIETKDLKEDILHQLEVPTMLIQPFIENSIIHGLIPKKTFPKNLKIKLQFNNELIATIEDNGIGRIKKKENANHKSMGLQNVENRLILYGKYLNMKTKMEIIDLVDNNNVSLGTKVKIVLPYRWRKL